MAAGLWEKGRKIYLKPHFLVLGLVQHFFARPQPPDQHSVFLAFLELLSFISIILKCLPALGVLSWLCFPKHPRRTSIPAITLKDVVKIKCFSQTVTSSTDWRFALLGKLIRVSLMVKPEGTDHGKVESPRFFSFMVLNV